MSDLELFRIRKGRLVLEALKKYGILDRSTLQKVLPDICDKRSLQRTLARLVDRKLIVKRYDTISAYRGTFYQLNQNPKLRKVLIQYLKCPEEQIKQHAFRYKELFHEQTATLISYYFSTKYPEAIVLKDYNLNYNDEAKRVIPYLDSTDQPKPDVLLIFKNVYGSKNLNIAVEYDRTVKSKNRLFEKLKFYTAKTHIDGVIYLCSQSRISENLAEIYDSRILSNALRIKQYGKNFLLTSVLKTNVENSFDLLKNQSGDNYSIDHWLKQLKNNPTELRRDEQFS